MHVERRMSMEWRARSKPLPKSLTKTVEARTLAWSNPVAWWWGSLALVSGANIAIWFVLYRQFGEQPAASAANVSGSGLMLLLCAGYVFGCAFRSLLPRADVQRIVLFDHWLCSVFVGRSVATVAEICFAAQWAMILAKLGDMTGAGAVLNIAAVIVPLIVIAECFSWYAVLTKNFLCNAIENSIWAVGFFLVGVALCRLLPEFYGPVRLTLLGAIGCVAIYLAFLMTIDVPMYLNRWRADRAEGGALLHPLEGLRDARTRWVVTHDLAEWKDEIAWMSLYFSAAVWGSLALCAFYSLDNYLPHYRTEAAIVGSMTDSTPAQR
jgi:hypothetical protein